MFIARTEGSLLKERVNVWLGSLFLGSWALAASLMIWHAATGSNPISDAMAKAIIHQEGLDAYANQI
ncbi:MAG: hypothetical protein KGI70_01265 [Patescibacteria group bacterium]|nr:hypothetical protein [Patescibacteria group bacterium]